MRLWFGEHEGKEVSDLPTRYLVWLSEDATPPIPPKMASEEHKREIRSQWKDLLSEVEEVLFERDTEGPTEAHFT